MIRVTRPGGRVTRPGGRVLVLDTDWGTTAVSGADRTLGHHRLRG